MQFWVILGLVGFCWLWMRRPDEQRSVSRDGLSQRDRNIEALTRRVAALETILLDRDRQLRDRFGDL